MHVKLRYSKEKLEADILCSSSLNASLSLREIELCKRLVTSNFCFGVNRDHHTL